MSPMLRRIGNKIVLLVGRSRAECDLAEEIELHREMKQREAEAAGLSPQDAQSAAARQMGNLTLVKEESRDMWMFVSLEKLWQDLRYAVRMIRKSPVFAAVAIFSLAIGIGGNAAMFSLVDALLLRPLPYPAPERLLRITGIYPKAALAAFRNRSRSMNVASFSTGEEVNLSGGGEALRLTAVSTSANFFSVLGANVERGRAFLPAEDGPGREPVVILSHSLWMSQFKGDANALGRVIRIDGTGRRVIGIMPAPFSFPSSKIQLWMPAVIDPSNQDDFWGADFSPLIARLRPKSTLAQARSEIQPIVSDVRARFPFPMKRDWNSDAQALPLQQDMMGEFRRKLLILLSAVGVVLLIACANVASLLLSRATTRRKEIALRNALGAARFRVMRQLLTESVLLAVLGGAAGILLGSAATQLFRSVLPADTPGLANVGIDWRVAAYVSALAILTGLAFGIAPALSASNVNLADAMKTGSQRSTAAFWTQLRSWLIAAEVAMTVVLVVAAGLMMKSLYRLSLVQPGFEAAHVLTVRISPEPSACQSRARCIALYRDLVTRARGIAGVDEAAVVNTLPLDGSVSVISVDVEDHPKSPSYPAPMFWTGAISPGYLRVMRIPVIEGRGISESDGPDSPAVVLITASTAKRFWPGHSAIGKHIRPTWERQWRTVVGVVADVHQYDLANDPPNWIPGAIYMPYPQAVLANRQLPASMDLVVRTSFDQARIASAIRQLAVAGNPNTPVGRVQTMSQFVADSVSGSRSTMWIFFSFAGAALILAAIGIYGLISYSTTQRTYEIGVRLALGASRASIVGMILSQGIRLTLTGMLAGFVAAFLLMRVLSSLLFGVAVNDPLTFASVGLVLLVIATAASYLPARRAARVDPLRSLRVD